MNESWCERKPTAAGSSVPRRDSALVTEPPQNSVILAEPSPSSAAEPGSGASNHRLLRPAGRRNAPSTGDGPRNLALDSYSIEDHPDTLASIISASLRQDADSGLGRWLWAIPKSKTASAPEWTDLLDSWMLYKYRVTALDEIGQAFNIDFWVWRPNKAYCTYWAQMQIGVQKKDNLTEALKHVQATIAHMINRDNLSDDVKMTDEQCQQLATELRGEVEKEISRVIIGNPE
jgi:hypothetical protein